MLLGILDPGQCYWIFRSDPQCPKLILVPINFTTYKAEEAGGAVKLVNPRNTSKQCSVCGCIQAMPLSQRTYRCPDCGNVMDRDHNAAINILNRHVPTDCGEFKPVKMAA
ncbi:MAG: transposase [Methanosarcinales archaeon]|nr:MAG: transposase [Methanosarcinales archaeon]